MLGKCGGTFRIPRDMFTPCLARADVNGDALPEPIMISRERTSLGLPTHVRVAKGRGDSWDAGTCWYSAVSSGSNAVRSTYAMADMNDDEMADLVVVTSNLDVYVIYSSGSAFVPPTSSRRRSLLAAASNNEGQIDPFTLRAARSKSAALLEGVGAAASGRTLLDAAGGASIADGSGPTQLSINQQRLGAESGVLAHATFAHNYHRACTAELALVHWPEVAPECEDNFNPEVLEEDVAPRAPFRRMLRNANTTRATHRSLAERRELQQATAAAGAYWLGTLPDYMAECTLHPNGLPLLQNVPGQQLIFSCRTGGLRVTSGGFRNG